MSWFLAPSLVALRDEVNARWPKRDKASDGAVGDVSHSARVSSHNPLWSAPGKWAGVVRAIDVDNNGRPGEQTPIVDAILKATIGDDRVWYVIWNRRIWSRTTGWKSKAYTGSNPHDKHVHVSLTEEAADWADRSPWLAKKPAPVVPPADVVPLRFGHLSMRYSLTRAQHRADAEKVFSRGYHVITGTEATPFSSRGLRGVLKAAAKKHGYRIAFGGLADTWVAVEQNVIVRGTFENGHIPVIARRLVRPMHSAKGITWASFEHKELGNVAVAAVHYLTRKMPDSKRINKRYAKAVGKWAEIHGKGAALAFVAGDSNMNDRLYDVLLGEPLTTCWDDVRRWPDTGHGPIDFIARSDRDLRVSKAVSARAFNDKALRLNSDHFLITATYNVKKVRR